MPNEDIAGAGVFDNVRPVFFADAPQKNKTDPVTIPRIHPNLPVHLA
jgi:hypothetical protein